MLIPKQKSLDFVAELKLMVEPENKKIFPNFLII
jgi:hypothetical protein